MGQRLILNPINPSDTSWCSAETSNEFSMLFHLIQRCNSTYQKYNSCFQGEGIHDHVFLLFLLGTDTPFHSLTQALITSLHIAPAHCLLKFHQPEAGRNHF